jgi:hypothetical protein
MADFSKCECPQNSSARQSGGDGEVLINIHIVIVIDERVPNRLAECQPNDRR